MIPRRRFLQLAAATSAAVAVLPETAHAETEGTITDLGPASVASPLGNGEFVGDVLYAGSRGLSPNVVGAYDLTADRVTRHFDIPTGIGIWAMCKHGTDVYVGTHAPSDLYRIDTVAGTVTRLASLPDHFVWSMAAAPDGKVYLGTSEPGRLVEYDPATGTTRDLGQPAPGEAYVRAVQADEKYVYAGIGTHAHLIAIDRATGDKRDLLPAELATRDWVSSMSVSDTHVAGGMNSLAELIVFPKADPSAYKVVKASAAGEKYIVSVLITGDWVYFAGRPSGTLYRCRLDGGGLEAVGVPFPEAATVRLLEHGGKVYGLQDNGVFVYDGTLEYRNLVQRGFKATPEEPMSVHSDGERVYVGGKSGADIHDLATGKVTRLPIGGEPKTMITVKGVTYLGVYTQAALYSHRPGDPDAELVKRTGNEQDRPRDLAYDARTGLIVMPTQPEPGHINGALSLYSPRRGAYDTYRPAVERQTVYTVVTRHGTAYLGTLIQEGLGLPPVTTTARLAAFDLVARKLLWQVEPVPGARHISSLSLGHTLLYGMASTGDVFEFDPVRRQVTRMLKVGAKGGEIFVVGRVAYCGDGDRIYRLDLETFTAETIAAGLAGQWFGGEPKLALDPSRRALYAVKARNLVRVAINPAG
ncbi:PQQ-binding-like beta-propeller repeat protein [Nonomuraea sediminis]|uniref:PQQ-binding-like beta-propeller repeat protein n=1 Tax=Nonomuraea sediminis TaxID=2835864 RepID=UPI001BDCFBD7|nr:PQQ-binding-like beta-propeller repeat protein [Nonomuraea sediminis]